MYGQHLRTFRSIRRCRHSQRRFYFVTSKNDRFAAAFSSWQYPEVPWRRISEEDIEKARKLVLLQKQRDELTGAVQTAVRKHLQSDFPKAFALTSSRNIWKNFRTRELNEKAHTLLELNGFVKVVPPKSMDMLMLAEGVVAFPNIYSRIRRSNDHAKFLLFSQPIVKDSESSASTTTTDSSKNALPDSKYPPIVQEDIQLYRVLENQAEQIIDTIYETVHGIWKLVIKRPLEYCTRTIQVQINWAKRKLLSHADVVSPSDKSPTPKIRLPSMIDHADTVTVENLLVLGEERDEMKLYAHMTPSVRLVALPFVLGHKSASTLVSVSLVLFGAIPLAYRSLNYAFLYPGLSEALAASVIGTISYGIWSQRYNARVSQSQVVAHAMHHRLQARDDAVVLVLQEGAVRQVTQMVLSEYFDRLDKKTLRYRVYGKDAELMNHLTTPKVSVASTDLVDPFQLAIRLGLLVPVEETTQPTDAVVRENHKTKVKAVSLDEAVSRVQDSCQK